MTVTGKKSWHVLTTASLTAVALAQAPLASASPSTKVTQVTNWFAQPEQGGQWDAQATGLYAKAGLDMTSSQGGPQVSTVPLVASGKDTFGMASADTILLARAQGIPVVAIFAPIQIDPQVLIWHSADSVKGFGDMDGHPVYVSGTSPYWKYLTVKYKLTHAKQMTYTGSLVNFVHTKNAVIQGFVTQEPWVLKQQRVPVKYELIANSGFDPYQNLMFTTEQEIKNHPDVVSAFVKASQQGWIDYLNSPNVTNQLIKKYSPAMSTEEMKFSWQNIKPLVHTGDAVTHGIGYMSATRWDQLAKQMEAVGLLSKGFDTAGAFTDAFLPKK